MLQNKPITPIEWYLKHMAENIYCVAVTTHNTGFWIDILKDELKLMKEQNLEAISIIYFPWNGDYCKWRNSFLAIFDKETTSQDINMFIS